MDDRYQVFSTAVSCLYHDIQKIERTEMAKYGMKGPQAQCLLAMSRYPEGITAAALCQICERAKLLLTPQGQAAAQTVGEKARLAVEQAGVGLDDQQREIFYEVLALIARNLHNVCKNGIQTGDAEG